MAYLPRSPRQPLIAGLLFVLLLGLVAACVEAGPGGENGTASENGTVSEEPTVASQRPEAESPLTLGRGRADLTVEAALPATAAVGVDDDYLLVLRDLELLAPGAFYHVYLNLPEGTEPDPEEPYFVGNLSLFGPPPGDLPEGEEPVRQSASFDVGDRVRELAGRGEWSGEVRLTFVRGNPPPATAAAEPDAFIRVGEVSLVRSE